MLSGRWGARSPRRTGQSRHLTAFYQTEPGKYLLFFKSGQADAMTACFSEYSRKVLDKAKSRQPTIPEQMKQAEQQLAKEKPPKEHIKEVSHDR